MVLMEMLKNLVGINLASVQIHWSLRDGVERDDVERNAKNC